jgi:hypothetical protein
MGLLYWPTQACNGIAVPLPLLQLVCMIIHVVNNGIPENFNQEYVNIVPAIVTFLAAFMFF